jgi:hypothetical protein
MSNEAIENTRASFRPSKIATLFIGESAPAAGVFFYYGNSGMTRYMRRAIEEVCGPTPDFLAYFKAQGWYLDDLVLSPVNKLSRSERIAACRDAQDGLADRVKEYKPLAIVTLLMSIRDIVIGAATKAGCSAPIYALPFPGMGHQGRFHAEMIGLISSLPRSS